MNRATDSSVGMIDDAQREVLAALADILVPAAEGMPAASEVNVQGRWIDRTLAARPDLAAPLRRILDDAVGADPKEHIDRLVAERPEDAEELLGIVTAAYYMSPKVRKRLRYPGQKANPTRPDEAEYYLRDGLLDPVIARGPIYRSV